MAARLTERPALLVRGSHGHAEDAHDHRSRRRCRRLSRPRGCHGHRAGRPIRRIWAGRPGRGPVLLRRCTRHPLPRLSTRRRSAMEPSGRRTARHRSRLPGREIARLDTVARSAHRDYADIWWRWSLLDDGTVWYRLARVWYWRPVPHAPGRREPPLWRQVAQAGLGRCARTRWRRRAGRGPDGQVTRGTSAGKLHVSPTDRLSGGDATARAARRE